MAKTNRITLSKIDGEIKSFTTNRDSLLAQAATIAMMIVYHAAPTDCSEDCNGSGDCTRAANLLSAMPKSWQVQYRTWLNDFTPIRVSSDGQKAGYAPEYHKLETAEEKLAMWDVQGAVETPFYEYSKEPTVEADFDFLKLKKVPDQMANRISKMIEKGRVPAEDIPSAEALVALLSALNVARVEPVADNDTDSDESEEEAPVENAA